MGLFDDNHVYTNEESQRLIAEGFQWFEGKLISPDEANNLIRSGHIQEHLAEGLHYTFTSLEKKKLANLGIGVIGFGLISWGVSKVIGKRKKNN
jgi:hypothetical protein